MKSSTIRRSTLSKESMEVIETLSKEQEINDNPEEYVRSENIANQDVEKNNKSQEIDLLWQNFKTTQFNYNSPAVYILIGTAIGIAIAIIICTAGYFGLKSRGYSIVKAQIPTIEEQTYTQADSNAEVPQDSKVSVPAEDETVSNETHAPNSNAENNTETAPVSSQTDVKKYVVKDGDTGENIIKKYYGAYTPERAERVMKANNLKSLDRINIDQVLIIPAE